MRILFCYLLLGISSSYVYPQDFSIAVPLQNNHFIQSSYATPVSDGFYLTGQYLEYSANDVNSAFSVYKFDQGQSLNWKKEIQPTVSEFFFQLLTENPVVTINEKLFTSNTFKNSDWNEFSALRGFNSTGLEWQSEFRPLEGYSANIVVQKSQSDTLCLVGITYPTTPSPTTWPGLLYYFNTEGIKIDSVEFNLPLPNTGRAYESISKALWTDSGLVALVNFTEIVGNEFNQGVILFKIAENGEINWYTEYYDTGAIPRSITYLSGNELLYVVFEQDEQTYCLKIFEQGNGNELNSVCLLDALIADPYYLSISGLTSDSQGAIYILMGKYQNYSSVVKLNSSGEKIWERHIREHQFGASVPGYLTHIEVQNNDDLLLSGFLNQDPSNQNPLNSSFYYWIMSLGTDGCYNNICTDTIDISGQVVSSVETAPNEISVSYKILPNPVSDFLYVETNTSLDEACSATISDIYGRNIFRISFSGRSDNIYVGDLQPGVYVLSLATPQHDVPVSKCFIKS